MDEKIFKRAMMFGLISKLQEGGVFDDYRRLHPETADLSDDAISLIIQLRLPSVLPISVNPAGAPLVINPSSVLNNGMSNLTQKFNTLLLDLQKDYQKNVNLAKLAGVNTNSVSIGSGKGLMSIGAAAGVGIASNVVAGAVNMVDLAVMGDKNFGAQSEAIDGAVHAASGALLKSGNPYAMIAGAALEGANFLTKAGGQTVQGFDVDINSSGYDANMGHMSSKSNRDFGAMIGLGGLNQGKIDRQLAKRNELMQMALKAANIANDVKFEQEARANAVEDVLMQNQIALAGGIDTELLGG